MKAEISKWSQSDRVRLADVVPLDTPLSIQVEPCSGCNFKCSYCYRQMETDQYCETTLLSLSTFQKLIDDCKGFKQPIKSMIFARMGEPTLNPKLPEMIRYAKESGVVKTAKVITNGSMLRPELNLQLIDAGLDVLRISIQGLTDEKYISVCGFPMKVCDLISNIKHFYEHRKQCKIFIKILDSIIEGEEKNFYKMFGDICDEIAIEHTMTTDKQEGNRKLDPINMVGENVKHDVITCPIPFYAMNIGAAGDVEVCSIMDHQSEFYLGTIQSHNIVEIWNGSLLNDFRVMQLKGNRFSNSVCATCSAPASCLQSSDYLDDISNTLIKFYIKEEC